MEVTFSGMESTPTTWSASTRGTMEQLVVVRVSTLCMRHLGVSVLYVWCLWLSFLALEHYQWCWLGAPLPPLSRVRHSLLCPNTGLWQGYGAPEMPRGLFLITNCPPHV